LLVNSDRVTGLRVATYSALILFFELALIRYTAGYVRVFSFYLNFVLIATFLGMGVGLLRADLAAKARWIGPAALLTVAGAVWFFSHTHIVVPADPNEYVWGIFDGVSARQVPLSVVVVSLFTLCALFFVPLGALLGEQFKKMPPLTAYAWDIGGSLCGILAFGVLSSLRAGPMWWFGIGTAVWVVASLDQRRFAAAVALAGAALVMVAGNQSGPRESWSPYYRIDVKPDGPAYRIDVNGSLHQIVMDLDSVRANQFAYTRTARNGYVMPYRWVTSVDTVLIVGSGTGNDIAIALQKGAKHVDAVEIDPVIADLGKELHKQAPYADPRVHLHVDDARAFLRRATQKYDLIIFGTLDSQTLLSGMSSVRLDNYVYTVESFASARRRLKETGSLVLYHMSPQPYIGAKIYQMVGEAFGKEPGVAFGNMNLFNLIVVAGEAASRVPPADPALLNDLRTPYDGAHDNWPYLYLREHTVPGHYWAALFSVILVAVVLVGGASGRSLAGGADAGMFFMGAGFLLLETKSVTEMSLLFGSTWTVNLLVFASILLVVLAANRFVAKGRAPRLAMLFSGLFAALMIAYAIPASDLLWLGTIGQWTLGGLLVATPLFFASMIFSSMFATRTDTARALAWNLLGAIAGGVLEYSSMAIGIKGLYVIAALLYAAAFHFPTRRTEDPAVNAQTV
jgi:SAM-dependent methyltransferase